MRDSWDRTSFCSSCINWFSSMIWSLSAFIVFENCFMVLDNISKIGRQLLGHKQETERIVTRFAIFVYAVGFSRFLHLPDHLATKLLYPCRWCKSVKLQDDDKKGLKNKTQSKNKGALIKNRLCFWCCIMTEQSWKLQLAHQAQHNPLSAGTKHCRQFVATIFH